MDTAASRWIAIRPAFLRLASSVALAALPTIAPAQSLIMPAASLGISKSEAILGGSSALDRLLAQQGVALSFPSAPLPLAQANFITAPPVSMMAPAILRDTVSAERPDVFNSVALAIPRTPLSARWSHAARGTPDAPATHFATSLVGRDAMRRIEAVNLYVNRRVHFVSDDVQYGVADYWAPAAQTLRRGKGDCEDFAIAKLAMLRRAGFAEHDLYLVIARDLVRREDHAVAVVRAEGAYWVLDNGTDVVLDSADVQDYRPVLSFSAGHSWTHGYRRTVPPMVLASAAPMIVASAPAVEPVTVASLQSMLSYASLSPASDQRSRSASLFAFNIGLSK